MKKKLALLLACLMLLGTATLTACDDDTSSKSDKDDDEDEDKEKDGDKEKEDDEEGVNDKPSYEDEDVEGAGRVEKGTEGWDTTAKAEPSDTEKVSGNYTPGRISGNTYTNDSLGLEFTLGRGMEFADVANSEMAVVDEENGSRMIITVIEDDTTGVTEELLLQTILDSAGAEVTEKEEYTIEIGGKTYTEWDVVLEDGEGYAAFAVCVEDGLAIMLAFSSESVDGLNAMLECLEVY